MGEGGAALARLGGYAFGDWQTGATRLAERGKHLLDTGVWSDCEFIVGIAPNMKIFHCHKLLLARASTHLYVLRRLGRDLKRNKDT